MKRSWLMTTAALLGMACATQRTATVDAPAQDAQGPRDRTFIAKLDDSEQRYMEILPPGFNSREPHGLMIALHGHGSDRHQYATDQRDECRGARDAAAKYSMVFISPDYRATTSWMGPAAEADMVQLIKEKKREYKIDKVVIAGASMGGTSALIFTALHPGLVQGVVSQNGMANMLEYDQFQDAIQASYGGDKQQKPEEYRKRSAELVPGSFAMPIAITTGGLDTLVPPQSVLRLAEALKQRHADLLLIHRPETGHLTNYADTMAAMEFVLSRVYDRD